MNDKLFVTKTISPNDKTLLLLLKLQKREIENLINKINKPLNQKTLKLKKDLKKKIDVFKGVKSNTGFKEFKSMVEKAKEAYSRG